MTLRVLLEAASDAYASWQQRAQKGCAIIFSSFTSTPFWPHFWMVIIFVPYQAGVFKAPLCRRWIIRAATVGRTMKRCVIPERGRGRHRLVVLGRAQRMLMQRRAIAVL